MVMLSKLSSAPLELDELEELDEEEELDELEEFDELEELDELDEIAAPDELDELELLEDELELEDELLLELLELEDGVGVGGSDFESLHAATSITLAAKLAAFSSFKIPDI